MDIKTVTYIKNRTGHSPQEIREYAEDLIREWKIDTNKTDSEFELVRTAIIGSYRHREASEGSDIDILTGFRGLTSPIKACKSINDITRDNTLYSPVQNTYILLDFSTMRDVNFDAELEKALSEGMVEG